VASKHHVAVTAQGGRSSVVGAPSLPKGYRARHDRTRPSARRRHGVGHVSVEAGSSDQTSNERWRSRLDRRALPQSFELATVGAGALSRVRPVLQSLRKIEDIVRGMSVVLASGESVELAGRAPASGRGPGPHATVHAAPRAALGVITRATLVMAPPHEERAQAAYGFSNFDADSTPVAGYAARRAAGRFCGSTTKASPRGTSTRESCALIVLDEGDSLLGRATMRIVAE